MPIYDFRIGQGLGATDTKVELQDAAAACLEAILIFGDLARDISIGLGQRLDWSLVVQDEEGGLVCRLTVALDVPT